MMILSFAPFTPPASLTCFSSICNVTVLVRPHSANGPLLGTIAPSTTSRLEVCAAPCPANPTARTAPALAAKTDRASFDTIRDLLSVYLHTPPFGRHKPGRFQAQDMPDVGLALRPIFPLAPVPRLRNTI